MIKSFQSFLPEKFLDDYLKLADHMGEQSIRNVMKSVFDSFDFKTYDGDMRILFMHGTKGNEIVSGKSAVKMKKANPQTEIKVFKGYAHAELACFKSGDWIREVSDWLGEK